MSSTILHDGGLEFHATDGEPRIRDLDLAEKLGYEHPRRIRELIEKNTSRLGVLTRTVQTPGATGGRPGTEYWLTERQALFVTTQSRTERAADVSMMLVDAFIAVRQQLTRDEQALKTIPRRLVEALLLPKPVEDWERMFQPSLTRAICELHGIRYEGGTYPRFLSSTNRKIYDLVFSSGIGALMKRRNPLPKWGSNHHQHLTSEARDYFAAQLRVVESIARQSASKHDFWRRMQREYSSGMLQLSMEAAL